jgi:uracil-DNA glycosylase
VIADELPAAFLQMPRGWRAVLPSWAPEQQEALVHRVRSISGDRPIAPDDPFRAMRLVSPERVKVVILGQDPYPTSGHADGLAFSAGTGRPVSLRRIFSVLAQDRPGWVLPASSSLDDWAHQGVLLLNTVLTVEVGRIGSHLQVGWQAFTAQIVAHLVHRAAPPHFLLWGARAHAFFEQAAGAEASSVKVHRTRHPSNDFRREFMGEGSHFLATAGLVDWWALSPHRLDGAPESTGQAPQVLL